MRRKLLIVLVLLFGGSLVYGGTYSNKLEQMSPRSGRQIGEDGEIVNVADNLALPTTPAIYNVTMTSTDTEYSQALPANTEKFTIQCRGPYDVKLSFTSGQSGTTYLTIKAGTTYWEDNIKAAAETLYFQSSTAGQVLEIVAWN